MQKKESSRMRLWILLAILVLLAAGIFIRRFLLARELTPDTAEVALPVGPAFNYPADKADKVRILDLLRARKYAELNALLEGYQKDFERDFLTEYTVFDAFESFSTQGPQIEPFLDEWVAQMPGSFPPYLARGCHYNARGWETRGSEWASETSEEQFSGMEDYFGKAQKDFDAALKLNPNLLSAYVFSVDISNASGHGSPEQWFREGEKHMPYSLMLRVSFMGTLAPRWGGSYREMEKFADESEALSSHNPNLRVLQGYIDFDKGSLACVDEQYAAAVKQFTKALSYGEFYLYLEYRARCLGGLEKNHEAMADLDRAVRLRPQRVEILLLRAERLVELQRFEEARAAYDLIFRLDPECPDCLSRRKYSVGRINYFGYQQFNQNHLPQAMKIFNEAQSLDPANSGPYYYRAAVFNRQNDNKAALENLEKSIELNPHFFGAYSLRDSILANNKEWDKIIGYMNAYIALEPKKPEGYAERAKAYRSKSDLAAAQADLKIACDLGDQASCRQFKALNH